MEGLTFTEILFYIVIAGLFIYALKRAGVGGPNLERVLCQSADFLQENRHKEGVVETDSGLQYQLIERGSGEQRPAARDQVLVHYHGTLLNGVVFDSSVERKQPIAFGLDQVIPGWTEGLQYMAVGDKARLWIPADLGYGNRKVGNIPAGSLLIFDVELLEIQAN